MSKKLPLVGLMSSRWIWGAIVDAMLIEGPTLRSRTMEVLNPKSGCSVMATLPLDSDSRFKMLDDISQEMPEKNKIENDLLLRKYSFYSTSLHSTSQVYPSQMPFMDKKTFRTFLSQFQIGYVIDNFFLNCNFK